MAQGVNGVTLESESYVGVDAGGNADVGVAEEFLDDDEVNALFQEQVGGRVPEIVEADGPKVGAVEEAEEAAVEVARVERPALRARGASVTKSQRFAGRMTRCGKVRGIPRMAAATISSTAEGMIF